MYVPAAVCYESWSSSHSLFVQTLWKVDDHYVFVYEIHSDDTLLLNFKENHLVKRFTKLPCMHLVKNTTYIYTLYDSLRITITKFFVKHGFQHICHFSISFITIPKNKIKVLIYYTCIHIFTDC